MFLRSLSVERFRNILSAELEFSSRITVFEGRNGQGKTSLLEAIYLLGHLRSFRTSKGAELLSKLPGDGPTVVSGKLDTSEGEKEVRYQFRGAKRQVFLNDHRITGAAEFFGSVKVIDFTPDDLFLVKGAPGERRQFLDKLLALVDREYVESLVRYQRALKQRNALLRDNDAPPSPALRSRLSHWEETLVSDGKRIATKRTELAEQLSKASRDIYASLLLAPRGESITCRYKSAFLETADPRAAFDASFERDLGRKSTTFGVHRDDLIMEIEIGFGAQPIREIASQGQSRSAALALKLAGVEFLRSGGEEPIVLLDDVESELDRGRRERLLGYLLELKSQIFVATTDRNALAGPLHDPQVIEIEGERSGEMRELTAKLVRFKTADGVELQGLLYEPKRSKTVIIHIHGLVGNFYENLFVEEIARSALSLGCALLTFNNRGAGIVTDFVRERGETCRYDRAGGSLERFEDGVLDIESAVRFVKKRGYRDVILQCHSLGCQKAAHYCWKKKPREVKGVIFLAPVDDVACAKMILGKRYNSAVETARRLAKADGTAGTSRPSKKRAATRPPKHLAKHMEFYPLMTARRFLDIASPQTPAGATLDYNGKLKAVRSIKVPMLAVFCERDQYQSNPSAALKSLREANPLCDTVLFHGGGHLFPRKENFLARTISTWLVHRGVL